MKRAIKSIFALVAFLLLPGMAFSGGSTPPADIVRLEREVSLRIAHIRDLGPVEPDKRKTLSEAQELDAKGEQALKAGDFAGAGNYFERARNLLDQLGS